MSLLRIGILVLFFLSGWFDAAFLRRKDLACATWAIGLAGLAIWIVYPLTIVRIFLGAVVALAGIVGLRAYYVNRSGQAR